jgi:trehalose/maltose hydrolase-like predicted phosphorylase
VHIAALGGLWQVGVFGFAGLSLGPDALSFDPLLPETWQQLSFAVQWRGRKLHISIDAAKSRFDAELRDGMATSVVVRGTAFELRPGQTLRVSLKP